MTCSAAPPSPARRHRFWLRCAIPCSPSSDAPAASPSKDSNTSPNTDKTHWTPLPAGEPNDPVHRTSGLDNCRAGRQEAVHAAVRRAFNGEQTQLLAKEVNVEGRRYIV